MVVLDPALGRPLSAAHRQVQSRQLGGDRHYVILDHVNPDGTLRPLRPLPNSPFQQYEMRSRPSIQPPSSRPAVSPVTMRQAPMRPPRASKRPVSAHTIAHHRPPSARPVTARPETARGALRSPLPVYSPPKTGPVHAAMFGRPSAESHPPPYPLRSPLPVHSPLPPPSQPLPRRAQTARPHSGSVGDMSEDEREEIRRLKAQGQRGIASVGTRAPSEMAANAAGVAASSCAHTRPRPRPHPHAAGVAASSCAHTRPRPRPHPHAAGVAASTCASHSPSPPPPPSPSPTPTPEGHNPHLHL